MAIIKPLPVFTLLDREAATPAELVEAVKVASTPHVPKPRPQNLKIAKLFLFAAWQKAEADNDRKH